MLCVGTETDLGAIPTLYNKVFSNPAVVPIPTDCVGLKFAV